MFEGNYVVIVWITVRIFKWLFFSTFHDMNISTPALTRTFSISNLPVVLFVILISLLFCGLFCLYALSVTDSICKFLLNLR